MPGCCVLQKDEENKHIRSIANKLIEEKEEIQSFFLELIENCIEERKLKQELQNKEDNKG